MRWVHVSAPSKRQCRIAKHHVLCFSHSPCRLASEVSAILSGSLVFSTCQSSGFLPSTYLPRTSPIMNQGSGGCSLVTSPAFPTRCLRLIRGREFTPGLVCSCTRNHIFDRFKQNKWIVHIATSLQQPDMTSSSSHMHKQFKTNIYLIQRHDNAQKLQ